MIYKNINRTMAFIKPIFLAAAVFLSARGFAQSEHGPSFSPSAVTLSTIVSMPFRDTDKLNIKDSSSDGDEDYVIGEKILFTYPEYSERLSLKPSEIRQVFPRPKKIKVPGDNLDDIVDLAEFVIKRAKIETDSSLEQGFNEELMNYNSFLFLDSNIPFWQFYFLRGPINLSLNFSLLGSIGKFSSENSPDNEREYDRKRRDMGWLYLDTDDSTPTSGYIGVTGRKRF